MIPDVINVEKRAKDVAEKHFNATNVTGSANFRKDFGADELDEVEFIMKLEREFNISIPDSEAEQILTVQQAIDCVTKHLQEQLP